MEGPKIIAISGPMGSGKSTAIATLEKYLSKRKNAPEIKLIKFADALYDMQAYIYRRIGKPAPIPKDRKLLQWLGTEWGREQDENLWVKLWLSEVSHAVESWKNSNKDLVIVCDDCRFDNEAVAVKQIGGQIVKLSADNREDRIQIINPSHKSEAGISDQYVDFIIENNKSLTDFEITLFHFFSDFMGL